MATGLALFLLTLLNGVSYGLLLFMLSAGLTVIFSLMGVLNFAHASFYMLGAYLAYQLSAALGFWLALLLAPLLVGLLGALFQRYCLRRVQRSGHVAEMLATFGLSYLLLELVQLLWGRASLPWSLPPLLQGPLWTLHGVQFPRARAFIMLVALAMFGLLWLLLVRTRAGLLLRAALTQPSMVQALGHDLPLLHTLVFGGGCALAALAGVLGGGSYVTEPAMAAALGPIVFVVVVVGGIGSLGGAFWAALLIGCLQTFAVAAEGRLWNVPLAQLAPLLPYLLLVLMLLWRPQGLRGAEGG
ncbi:MAG: branched-chain amino acid ABC transporter permease [Comamonadaceae bacterium]|jgi:branched-chain amino acid transport system permease protein|nr:branched-chain amino acid ABC transporter permease [Comamonadaceae bacterium]